MKRRIKKLSLAVVAISLSGLSAMSCTSTRDRPLVDVEAAEHAEIPMAPIPSGARGSGTLRSLERLGRPNDGRHGHAHGYLGDRGFGGHRHARDTW